MEKYTIIKNYDSILRSNICPIQVEKYNILLSNTIGKNIIQIKFRNTVDKKIKSIFLDIDCCDDAKEYVTTLKDIAYVGLNISKSETFGDKQPVKTDTNIIGNIGIKITKIIFDDESIWKNESNTYLEEIPKPISAREHFGELFSQYERECNKIKIDKSYAYINYNDYWQCVCGQPNNSKDKVCFNCHSEKSILEKISNLKFLTEEKNKFELDKKQRAEAEKQRAETEKQRAEETARLRQKIIGLICAVIVIFVGIYFAGSYCYKLHQYNKAVELFENKKYDKAINYFENLKGFKNSKHMIKEIQNKMYLRNSVISSYGHTVGLKNDGVVIAVGHNGSGQCNVSNWKDIIAISVGYAHTLGLKNDGTVVAVGNNDYGQCNVGNWKDMVAISAGGYHTVGLKSDGTVVTVGRNYEGQCNVESWEDIVAISAGNSHIIGLRSDGTVVAVGRNYEGQCNVESWEDIIAISAGGYHTLGLKGDGTVVAVGNNDDGQCDISSWKDIVAIYAGNSNSVGLRSDGTVVAVGNNKYDQCNVESWEDIVAISAGHSNTVGLKSDGTMVAVGYNTHGQCDVSSWKNIKIYQ